MTCGDGDAGQPGVGVSPNLPAIFNATCGLTRARVLVANYC